MSDRRQRLADALAWLEASAPLVATVAEQISGALRRGQKVLVAGNGGSAAEAQHFAGELVGRFRRQRRAYPVLALTADSAILTALANDYGYETVFARQVEAFGQPGDLLLAFSTSGESENLVRAAGLARAQGLRVVAVTGERPSRLQAAADWTIPVPLRDTALVQELHMVLTHILCDVAERELAAPSGWSA